MAEKNDLMRLAIRHRYMVRAIAMGIAAAIIVMVATLPFFESASSLSKKITARKKEAKDLADKVTVLSGLDQQVLEDRVKTLDQALPPKKDVILYLSTIDSLSQELGLNFGGISLSPGEVTEASISAQAAPEKTKSTTVGGLSILDTDIKIDGSQENIYAFLRALEESTPLMQIQDVKVSSLDQGEKFSLALRLGMLYAPADLTQVKGQIALFDQKEEAYFQSLASFRHFTPVTELIGEDKTLGKIDLFKEFKTTEEAK